MEFECPHCSLKMSSEDEHAGQVVACPGCKRRLQIPEIAPPAATTVAKRTPQSQRGGWPEADHANVSVGTSRALAVAITALFLGSLIPFTGSKFADIFISRGAVNWAETFLFIWGIVILVMKFLKTKRQSQAMLLDILPNSLGLEINSGNVGSYIEHIYKLPFRLRDSLMVNRIRKALELFEKRNNNGEVVNVLNAQSDIDANRVSGSYTLLKVFLWAIPILGFIGTVQGLSQAVSSLSAGSSDPGALKDSINNLTGGLGVAFDTTLLGLVLSMIMSFPMASMQKREEEVLTRIDAFCNEKLLPKLNDSKSAVSDNLLAQAASLPEFAASLSRAHESFLIQLTQATSLLKDTGETLRSRLAAHQTSVEGTFSHAIDKLTSETRDAFIRPTSELNSYFAALAEGVASLNAALGKLNGEKVVVVKRSFFGR